MLSFVRSIEIAESIGSNFPPVALPTLKTPNSSSTFLNSSINAKVLLMYSGEEVSSYTTHITEVYTRKNHIMNEAIALLLPIGLRQHPNPPRQHRGA
ncbi:unnamed protein product [Rhizophagus irregularis]|nr:unnamed protein product [Rhizophagus irregularis]CAB5380880.1 unnamed protein product [Rhizophagus irregularis]